MKGKTFLILLAVAGVLTAAAFLRFGNEKQSGETAMGTVLFSDLPVNQVAAVIISSADQTVTLSKGDPVWRVDDRGGYPADFDELRDIVVKLSRLKVGRRFAGSPDILERLSLLAPSAAAEKGRGTQITLKDASGKILADLILGQTREADGGGSGGQYLKRVNDDTVFLVDGSFRFLKSAPADWLKKEILDIKADAIAAVTCYAGDTQTPVYMLARPKKGERVQMSPIPPGETVDSAKVDQVLDALAPLTLDDVAAAGGSPPGDGTGPRLVYRLYDGRQITIFPESDGVEKYTLRLTAEKVAAAEETADTVEAAPGKSDSAEAGTTPSKTDTPVVKTAEQLNQELQPWIFSVKKWQFDSFITQPGDFLEAEKKTNGGTS